MSQIVLQLVFYLRKKIRCLCSQNIDCGTALALSILSDSVALVLVLYCECSTGDAQMTEIGTYFKELIRHLMASTTRRTWLSVTRESDSQNELKW